MSTDKHETGDGGVRCSAWLGRIVCGDNTEVLCQMPPESVDLVVTSPPYDDLRTYGGHSWDFFGVGWLLKRVLKPGGVIVWVVNDATKDGSESGTSMEQVLHFRRLGLLIYDTMVFQKQGMPTDPRLRYLQNWEYMTVLSKGRPKTYNPLKDRRNSSAGRKFNYRVDRLGDNLVTIPTAERQTGEFGIRTNIWEYDCRNMGGLHPAQFPVALAADHIKSWSNPGDIVLDPFAGSGTTCKAAKELNRQWCGIEINPEYCAVAEARLTQDVMTLEACDMRPNGPSSATRPTGGDA